MSILEAAAVHIRGTGDFRLVWQVNLRLDRSLLWCGWVLGEEKASFIKIFKSVGLTSKHLGKRKLRNPDDIENVSNGLFCIIRGLSYTFIVENVSFSYRYFFSNFIKKSKANLNLSLNLNFMHLRKTAQVNLSVQFVS